MPSSLPITTAVLFYLIISGHTLGSSNASNMPPKAFALLIAGTNMWRYYLDQANVCHAYQILRSHGIPMENIVMMMYDDIPYDSKNPYPGQIFNSPDGPDVYKGVRIDYRSVDITISNIIAILTGNSTAVQGGNGRVLRSGADDKIFIYFSGRGGKEYLRIISEQWSAVEINNLLKTMYKMEKYNELLFYIDSNQSGSIFDGHLPTNINAYAITATDPSEYSKVRYCSTEKINSTCLGRDFSTRWMEDAEQELWLKEIGTHFEVVQKHVKHSTVSEYGDLSVRGCYLQEYIGWEPS